MFVIISTFSLTELTAALVALIASVISSTFLFISSELFISLSSSEAESWLLIFISSAVLASISVFSDTPDTATSISPTLSVACCMLSACSVAPLAIS